MSRYYCSGFDTKNAFGHGLGEMFKRELTDTNRIVYILGNPAKIEKVKNRTIPDFTKHFMRIGIEFSEVDLIAPGLDSKEAGEKISEADFIMVMGGNPFGQKEMCEELGILEVLKEYRGVMLGYSAGAMLMSKYIIVTPCSDEYPDFRIEEGLDLDHISIYPHNNTSDPVYPEILRAGGECYKKDDLIRVAQQYGTFYLLQDNLRHDGTTGVSYIKADDGKVEFCTENGGIIWRVTDMVCPI